MDASDGAKHNGNGSPTTPDPVSLPSAAAPPAGGPVVSSTPEKKAGPPADPKRKKNGQFGEGNNANPRGNWKQTPTLNGQLLRVLKKFKLKDANGQERIFLEALLLRALQEPKLAEKLMDKVFADATPPAPAAQINNNNAPVAGASSSSNSYVNLAKLLASAEGRDGIAQFAERLAACSALPGESGNGRN